jgi:hypothetical protein
MGERIAPSQPVPEVAASHDLTAQETDRFRAQMQSLDDDALRRVVGADAGQYRAGALALAREEVARRGLVIESPAAAPPAKRAELRWGSIYAFLLALSVIAQAIVAVQLLGGAFGLAGLTILHAALGAAVVVGLVRRRRWGLSLNFVHLGLSLVIGAVAGRGLTQPVVLLVWTALNARYFWQHRHLFG